MRAFTRENTVQVFVVFGRLTPSGSNVEGDVGGFSENCDEEKHVEVKALHADPCVVCK